MVWGWRPIAARVNLACWQQVEQRVGGAGEGAGGAEDGGEGGEAALDGAAAGIVCEQAPGFVGEACGGDVALDQLGLHAFAEPDVTHPEKWRIDEGAAPEQRFR